MIDSLRSIERLLSQTDRVMPAHVFVIHTCAVIQLDVGCYFEIIEIISEIGVIGAYCIVFPSFGMMLEIQWQATSFVMSLISSEFRISTSSYTVQGAICRREMGIVLTTTKLHPPPP